MEQPNVPALVKYPDVREPEFMDYLREWEASGEKIIPYTVSRRNMSFDALKARWAVDESEAVRAAGLVPATLYFLVGGEKRILGAVHFRHELTEKLRRHGGHIGFGVRPTERRKGYAALMLGILLADLRRRGYARVMLTCDEDNVGSRRTIEKCNGVLEDRVVSDGVISRRYWIDLA